ncbi:hypothetical protein EVAR_63923_1 [Eumeta japonica]|uniref:Uncharacterized protein n=1 Tax=Eumeta variegata TaxID=151549 RepID=A0A4C1ZNJ5_EUMVA|nr:hypothetical protein EVAR_63923_1 [Eumeta japonica]
MAHYTQSRPLHDGNCRGLTMMGEEEEALGYSIFCIAKLNLLSSKANGASVSSQNGFRRRIVHGNKETKTTAAAPTRPQGARRAEYATATAKAKAKARKPNYILKPAEGSWRGAAGEGVYLDVIKLLMSRHAQSPRSGLGRSAQESYVR